MAPAKKKLRKKVAKKAVPGARKAVGKGARKKIARKPSEKAQGGKLPKARRPSGLRVERLYWTCEPGALDFKNTSEIEPLHDIMGQERAVKALRLGVDLFSPGYNIYVSGMPGTGKMSTVKKMLDKIRPRCPTLRDFCYVYNFKNLHNPVLLTCKQGGGKALRRRMEKLVQILQKELPAHLESGPIAERREALAESYLKRQKDLFISFEGELKENGFVLSQVRVGQMVRPEILVPVGEKAYPFDQLKMLATSGEVELPEEADLEEMEKKNAAYRKKMRAVMKESRRLNAEMMEKLEHLERDTVSDLIGDHIDDIKDHCELEPKIVSYLDEVKEHILSHLAQLKAAASQGNEQLQMLQPGDPGDPYLPYRVNVVLDNSRTRECPVVLETNPTYNNVFGTIERTVTRHGHTVTDFTKITSGSMLQADGGYLVMNAVDALSEPGLWKTLKRVLVHRELVIQGIEGVLQLSTVSLKPEAIDVNLTVILIGPPYFYFLLHRLDEDFRKIFKLRADFDQEIPLTDDAVRQYASFVAFLAEKESLRPFTGPAVGRLLEYGVRRAGRRNRVTSRFGEIADVIRESDFWAKAKKEKAVSRESVEKAIFERRERLSLLEEKVHDRIREGIVLIGTEGARVGQVNGLAVLTHGDHRFGIPSRITASVGVGKAGIVNVEREAKLSGSTHDKGVLILEGYLRDTFARQLPLSLTASICFEQSYAGVDGDSASSTELYAILSALSDVPLRQDLAVSGSVNQKGDIQAVGGVNEKIEGFFDVCGGRGLKGTEGVLIPASNVEDLMLNEEVRAAVAEGKFHIYAVSRVEEGIEILTGLAAGKRKKDGRWEKKSLYGEVESRLEELRKKAAPENRAGKQARRRKKKAGRKT